MGRSEQAVHPLELCGHCLRSYNEHVDEKCLFEATHYARLTIDAEILRESKQIKRLADQSRDWFEYLHGI